MRLLRVRLTIWRLMIVVLAVALACGWVVRQHRRQGLPALAKAQMMVTSRFPMDQGQNFGGRGPGGGFSGVRFLNRKPDQLRWVWTCKHWSHSENARTIDVEVSGGFDGSDLGPIVIKDGGGTRNARLIEAMTRFYRERGWRYEVMTPGAGFGTRSAK
jgi:hypothetical protein